jgi:hypothetical protein
MSRWIIVRCRMRVNRPEFRTDDQQVVIKEMQRYADSKLTSKKRHPVGALEYRVLGDRIMFYAYDRYSVRYEWACLKLIEADPWPGSPEEEGS